MCLARHRQDTSSNSRQEEASQHKFENLKNSLSSPHLLPHINYVSCTLPPSVRLEVVRARAEMIMVVVGDDDGCDGDGGTGGDDGGSGGDGGGRVAVLGYQPMVRYPYNHCIINDPTLL